MSEAATTQHDPIQEILARIEERAQHPLSVTCAQYVTDMNMMLAFARDVLAIHTPVGIYDLCGHDHTAADVEAGRAFEISELGAVCDDGIRHPVCHECHTDRDGEATRDTMEVSWPCPTYAAATRHLGGHT